MDNDAFPQLHEEIASQLGLITLKRPSVQIMVQGLLTAGMKKGGKAGPEIYSQLSGPAHASMSALGMYTCQREARFYLPDQIGVEQAGYLFAGVCVVAEAWLELFRADQTARDVWKVARRGAESSLRHLV